MELFFKAVFRTHYRFSIKGRTFFTIIAHNQNYIRCRLEELVNNIVFSLLINPDKGSSGFLLISIVSKLKALICGSYTINNRIAMFANFSIKNANWKNKVCI